MTVPPPAFVRLLNRFFRACGLFVADNDKMVLFVTLAFTILMSSKIAFTKQEDDIKTGYTPFGARSRDEIAAYNEYFAATGDPVSVFVFITAKDNGTMTRLEYMNETMQVLDNVGSNLVHNGYNFYNACSDFCQVNEPIRQFYNGLVMKQMQREGEEDRISLTFPLMDVLGKELDLSPNFFGVRTNETTNSIDFLKIIVLQFRANPPVGWIREDIAIYERMISTYYHKQYKSERLNIYAMSLTFTGDEIVRTGLKIFPFIAVGFTIMSIFSVITIYYSSNKMGQWSVHKISEAVLGCVCPLLATSSALGMLFWCGFRFGTILCVTPFLVLAIGVDDAYLMLHSWMRISSEDPTLTKRERLARMLVDVGPSISITSLTNFLAFIVGIYTPTPEIQLFCIGNAVAIIFDFFFQITMYASMMSLAGNLEMRTESKKEAVQWNPLKTQKFVRLLDDYCEWLSSKFTSVTLFIVICGYWWISVAGASNIRILLSPDKLVLSDSPLLEINHLRDNYVLQNYTTVNIFVRNPGDLSDPARLNLSNSLIETYESFPECLGSKFSHYFARDYLSFQKMGEAEEELEEEAKSQETALALTGRVNHFSKKAMNGFLTWPEFKHWNGFVKFNQSGSIEQYWATVSYHGEHLGDFTERKSLLKRWRDVADSFPELNVSIFDDYAMFIDQLDTILPATISTSACTLLCMMVVCFLFMYNVFTVVVATLSITSICIGVFGFLSLWNIDLDPISMATTIMSIGFSVDFPAHITFHYFREGLEEPDSPPSRRVAKSLAAIGFPLLQCGISTILFVLCLLFVETYMSEVFVKTMVLVVILGLIHGLILVPAFLCALTNIYQSFFAPKVGDNPSEVFVALLDVVTSLCSTIIAFYPIYGGFYSGLFWTLFRIPTLYTKAIMDILINNHSMSIFIAFAYKHNILAASGKWYKMSMKKFHILANLLYLTSVMYGVLLCLSGLTPQQTTDLVNSKYPELRPFLKVETFLMYDPELNYFIVYYKYYGISLIFILTPFMFAILVNTVILLRNKSAQMSTKTMEMQKASTKALLLQISVPIMFYIAPKSFDLALIFLKIGNQQELYLMGFVVSICHSSVFTLVMIFGTRAYRKVVLEKMRKMFWWRTKPEKNTLFSFIPTSTLTTVQ